MKNTISGSFSSRCFKKYHRLIFSRLFYVLLLIGIVTVSCSSASEAREESYRPLPNNWVLEEFDIPQDHEIRSEIVAGTEEKYDMGYSLYEWLPSSVYEYFSEQGFVINTYCIDESSGGDSCRHSVTDVSSKDQIVYSVDHEESALHPYYLVPYVWLFDDYWSIEIRIGGYYESELIKDIIIDGNSMNEKYGFDNSFRLHSINNLPFFFYERSGSYGFVYDSIEYPLDYSEIWYADCCAAIESNPRRYETFVWFDAKIDESDDYIWVVLGEFISSDEGN
ncbi:MAG: hypothetical protein K8R16_05160 [Anaerolineales bacterium]|nr:hypothetical protein [Anaerolineales bacterium]